MRANEIIARVAADSGFTVAQIRGRFRHKPLVKARHMAMYLCRRMTSLSLPQIGRVFNRDHSTIKHGCDHLRDMLVRGDLVLPEWSVDEMAMENPQAHAEILSDDMGAAIDDALMHFKRRVVVQFQRHPFKAMAALSDALENLEKNV